MAIHFGPQLPKGTESRPTFTKGALVKGSKPNHPINNEPNPGTPIKQERKHDKDDLLFNGKPGDYTIVTNRTARGELLTQVYYKDADGNMQSKEITLAEKREIVKNDSYFGPNNN